MFLSYVDLPTSCSLLVLMITGCCKVPLTHRWEDFIEILQLSLSHYQPSNKNLIPDNLGAFQTDEVKWKDLCFPLPSSFRAFFSYSSPASPSWCLLLGPYSYYVFVFLHIVTAVAKNEGDTYFFWQYYLITAKYPPMGNSTCFLEFFYLIDYF
jgi:hypothetical protein